MEWKWTHGGSYVKSKRQYNSNKTTIDDINQDLIEYNVEMFRQINNI